MKYQMLHTLLKHAEANVQLHKLNIRTYLVNPAGIGEHSDIMEAMQAEADKAAMHQDRADLFTQMIEEENEIDFDTEE